MKYIQQQDVSSPSKRGRKKGSKNFQSWQRSVLEDYIKNNNYDLYPSESEKAKLAKQINSSKKKISNWFINMRKRRFQSNEAVMMNKMRYKPKVQMKKRMEKEEAKFGIDQMQYSDYGLAMPLIQPLLEINKYCLCDFLPSLGFGFSCEGVSPQEICLIGNNAVMENNDKEFCFCEGDSAFKIVQKCPSKAIESLNF